MSFTIRQGRETIGSVKPWRWYTIRICGGGLVASVALHFLVDLRLDSFSRRVSVSVNLVYVMLLGLLVGLGGLAFSRPRYRLAGVSGVVLVGMYVIGKMAAPWIHPGDTGKFVLASLFVVPSVGLLVGFVGIARSARGWGRAAAVVAVVASSLLVGVMVLFITVGVALISSGFDGF